MRRLLLELNSLSYKFIQFELRDESDGSLYVVIDRRGEDPGSRLLISEDGSRNPVPANGRLKMSYHTTGRVHFQDTGMSPCYCEPIFAITQLQMLFCIYIPAISKLEVAEDMRADDIKIALPSDLSGSLKFGFGVGPSGVQLGDNYLSVDYAGLFQLVLVPGQFPDAVPLTKEDLDQRVVTAMIQRGPLAQQDVNKHQALIAFHQRLKGERGLIGSWNPSTGVYRIIFVVEMRVPPIATIRFADPQYEAVIQRCTPAEVSFSVRGKGGFERRYQVEISSIELNAEL